MLARGSGVTYHGKMLRSGERRGSGLFRRWAVRNFGSQTQWWGEMRAEGPGKLWNLWNCQHPKESTLLGSPQGDLWQLLLDPALEVVLPQNESAYPHKGEWGGSIWWRLDIEWGWCECGYSSAVVYGLSGNGAGMGMATYVGFYKVPYELRR